MHFDYSGRPVSYYSDYMELHIEYDGDNATYYFIINGISIIDKATIENNPQVKSGTEENIDSAIGIAGSKEWDLLWNKVASNTGTPLVGYVADFIEIMNFLKATVGTDALKMAEYTESDNDLVQLIDLIKTKSPDLQNNDFIRYQVGIKAGGAEIKGVQSASFELQGRIKGYSNGRTFNFEYGICYSATNGNPTFNDSVVSTVYVGKEGQTNIDITLPEWFEVSGLSEEKYYDHHTGNITYSANTEILELADKEYFFIGNEISGTSYDVAYVKWGGGARMPTSEDIQELIDKCTFSKGHSTFNSVAGVFITGPNGNYIFLPYAGDRFSTPTDPNCNLYYDGTKGYYWSGTYQEQSKYGYGAYALYCGNPLGLSRSDRYHGRPIRPVKNK